MQVDDGQWQRLEQSFIAAFTRIDRLPIAPFRNNGAGDRFHDQLAAEPKRSPKPASAFQNAADTLRRTARIEISKETLRQLVEAEGRDVQQAMQRAELGPAWSAEDCRTEQQTTRLYLGCDGVKVPLVTDEEKKKRGPGPLIPFAHVACEPKARRDDLEMQSS